MFQSNSKIKNVRFFLNDFSRAAYVSIPKNSNTNF